MVNLWARLISTVTCFGGVFRGGQIFTCVNFHFLVRLVCVLTINKYKSYTVNHLIFISIESGDFQEKTKLKNNPFLFSQDQRICDKVSPAMPCNALCTDVIACLHGKWKGLIKFIIVLNFRGGFYERKEYSFHRLLSI